jgi:hypothetical protein
VVRVIARLETDAVCRPVEDAAVDCPPEGKVAVSRACAGARPGDWLLLRTALNPRRDGPELKVADGRRLASFADLRPAGSLEAIRRILAEDGIEHLEPGLWSFRIEDGAVVTVRLERGGDGRLRARSADLRRLTVMAFRQVSIIPFQADDGRLLYEPGAAGAPLGVVNWSCDADYARELARALGADDLALSALEGLLRRHIDQASGQLSALGSLDLGIASGLLRSRSFLQRIRAERDLIASCRDLAGHVADPVQPHAASLGQAVHQDDPAPDGDDQAGPVDLGPDDLMVFEEVSVDLPEEEEGSDLPEPPRAAAPADLAGDWDGLLDEIGTAAGLVEARERIEDAAAVARLTEPQRLAVSLWAAAIDGIAADIPDSSGDSARALLSLAERSVALPAPLGTKRNILLQLAALLSMAVDDRLVRPVDRGTNDQNEAFRLEAVELVSSSLALSDLFADIDDFDCACQAAELGAGLAAEALGDERTLFATVHLTAAERARDAGMPERATALWRAARSALETLRMSDDAALGPLLDRAEDLRTDLAGPRHDDGSPTRAAYSTTAG